MANDENDTGTNNNPENIKEPASSPAGDDSAVTAQSGKDAKKAAAQEKKAKKAQLKAEKAAAKKQKKAGQATGSSKSPAPVLTTVSLIIALGACGASYWVWLEGNKKADGLEYSLKQMQQQSAGELQRLANERAALETRLNEALAMVANQQNQLNTKVDHLNDASKAISDRLGRNSTTWIVAEAEYLLNIANHRLLIDKDIASAVAALEAADARLRQVGDPGLLNVRRIIADEINALRSQAMPDVTGMAFELASLASSVEQLPLIVKQRREQFDNAFSSSDEAARQSGKVSGVMKAVWQDLKSLVVIRKNEKPIEALLAPDQRHFLFQNLILKLETGRLSLLRGEQANLKASLDVAQQWLQAYFDRDTPAYKNFEATISRIASTTLNPALPDITKSLRELRRFKQSKAGAKEKSGKSSLKTPTSTSKKQLVEKTQAAQATKNPAKSLQTPAAEPETKPTDTTPVPEATQ